MAGRGLGEASVSLPQEKHKMCIDIVGFSLNALERATIKAIVKLSLKLHQLKNHTYNSSFSTDPFSLLRRTNI